MAYNELIKNFERIRDYMRDFYVYGFKSRDDYTNKSARSYDDERRRLESWLGDHMGFRQTADGKNVFISINSRITHHNPLYKAWKAKSFTDGDITLFFILFDILYSPKIKLTNTEITEKIDSEYLCFFDEPKVFDSSTVRKKLKEYESQGLLISEKQGKSLYYKRAESVKFDHTDILDFFCEVAPCGVIGSFLLDKTDTHENSFGFKHHYINHTLDSEIMYRLFQAMHNKSEIEIEKVTRRSSRKRTMKVVPLNIFISVQNGRQYLMAYRRHSRRITSYRLDYITNVKELKQTDDLDELRDILDNMKKYMWGVSTQGRGGRKETVEFIVTYNSDEEYIYNRLVREKRCGTVEKIDENSCRFYAEVYDTNEMLTWIRSFICRITYINFSNKEIENQLREDLNAMYRLYGLE